MRRELTTLGDPLSDLAYAGIAYHLPPGGSMPGLANEDLDAVGIPSQKELNEHYCSLRALPMPSQGLWNFYMAFAFFRLAAIAQGVYKRGLDGNASSDKADTMGNAVLGLSHIGLSCSEAQEEEEEEEEVGPSHQSKL